MRQSAYPFLPECINLLVPSAVTQLRVKLVFLVQSSPFQLKAPSRIGCDTGFKNVHALFSLGSDCGSEYICSNTEFSTKLYMYEKRLERKIKLRLYGNFFLCRISANVIILILPVKFCQIGFNSYISLFNK